MRLKYLVTGTGRCGTVYMAKLLTALGVRCGHESVFDCNGLRSAERRLAGLEPVVLSHASQNRWQGGRWVADTKWFADQGILEAESSYMAAPFLDEDILQGAQVIHVVRHPVEVVQSFCNCIGYFSSHEPTNSYEHFIYQYLPELRDRMSPYERGCRFYLGWNRLIERYQPALFCRIEDGPGPVMSFLGLTGPPPPISTNTNSLRTLASAKFVLRRLDRTTVRDQVMTLGRRYGYAMAEEISFV